MLSLPVSYVCRKATVVVNVKTDDPEATKQYPALAYLNEKHEGQGLRILAFPTDQVSKGEEQERGEARKEQGRVSKLPLGRGRGDR